MLDPWRRGRTGSSLHHIRRARLSGIYLRRGGGQERSCRLGAGQRTVDAAGVRVDAVAVAEAALPPAGSVETWATLK
jgi:hypothetical protein